MARRIIPILLAALVFFSLASCVALAAETTVGSGLSNGNTKQNIEHAKDGKFQTEEQAMSYIDFRKAKKDYVAKIKIASPHYNLDTDAGVTDVLPNVSNALSNMFFSISTGVGKLAAMVSKEAYNFSLAETIGKSFNGLFSGLKTFTDPAKNPLILFGMAILLGISGFAMVRGSMAHGVGGVAKIILIFVIAAGFFAYGPIRIMNQGNEITKYMAQNVMLTSSTGVKAEKTPGDTCAKVTWMSMVDYPWQMLEGGEGFVDNTPMVNNKTNKTMIAAAEAYVAGGAKTNDNPLTQIFAAKGGERSSKVSGSINWKGEEKPAVEWLEPINHKISGFGTVGDVLMLTILNLLIGIGIIVTSALIVAMQFITLILLIMFPLIIVMAFLPGYGVETLKKWGGLLMFTFIAKIVASFMLAIVFVFLSWGYATLISEIGISGVFLVLLGLMFAIYLSKGLLSDLFGFNRMPKTGVGEKLNQKMHDRKMIRGTSGGGSTGGKGRTAGGVFSRGFNKIPAVQTRRTNKNLRRQNAYQEALGREEKRLKNRDKGAGYAESKMQSRAERRKYNKEHPDLKAKTPNEAMRMRKAERAARRKARFEHDTKNTSLAQQIADEKTRRNNEREDRAKQDIGGRKSTPKDGDNIKQNKIDASSQRKK